MTAGSTALRQRGSSAPLPVTLTARRAWAGCVRPYNGGVAAALPPPSLRVRFCGLDFLRNCKLERFADLLERFFAAIPRGRLSSTAKGINYSC